MDPDNSENFINIEQKEEEVCLRILQDDKDYHMKQSNDISQIEISEYGQHNPFETNEEDPEVDDYNPLA